jgi:hypothetical protein
MRAPQSSLLVEKSDDMAIEAKRIVRAKMIRRVFSFMKLVDAMNSTRNGDVESVQSLINKIYRGCFSLAIFLRAVRAMGMSSVGLTPLTSRVPE